MSLRKQLFVGAFLVTVFLGAVLLFVLPRQLDALSQQALEEEAQAMTALLAELSGPSVQMSAALDDPSLAGDSLPALKSSEQVVAAEVYSPDGVLLAQYPDQSDASPEFVGDAGQGVKWSDSELVSWRELRDRKGTLHGFVQLHVSMNRLEAFRSQNRRTALLLTAGVGTIVLLSFLVLGGRLTGPVLALTRTASRVAEGRLGEIDVAEATNAVRGSDELSVLTRSFYSMLGEIRASQEALEGQTREAEQQRRVAESERQQADQQRQVAETERERSEQALRELHQAQDQLVKSEKLATLGQLVAGIAHEINTPIGAVKASGEIIQERLRLTVGAIGERANPQLRERLELAMALVDDANGRARLGGRDGRKARRELAKALEARGLDNASMLADTLLEVGYRPDSERWVDVVSRDDIVELSALTELLSPLVRNTDNVRLAARKASRIVVALKTFAHQGGPGERAEIRLDESIRTVLTLYENQLKRGIAVDMDVPEGLVVLGDDDSLSQVWTNLVQNAVQAMKGEGRLWVRGDVEESDRCVIRVGNNGPPIPPEVMEKIFEPFFTTKPAGEGTGLGLDIVRRIVRDHDGDISVVSTQEATEFSVSLPLQTGAA